ncbi:hypothetical protein BAUCODRAFT_319300 [Baudoinia panamericana UAMH 10762]|uniref:DSBA-like thioredoxin domain-containing protein n=1 Tax=Baudoinia panamericana (strain UAMH 10762) TaxID=717646 RepID=M2MX66_BAUPA|nr:uncharacterized protein BAUCODRAFT_319300 [Baudoinia panamericana UAMH 10762]EMC91239.1 hypothetical protein BAUCODRAFT_319300 [Baudoinia panamericana UAMH 10762]
MNAVGNKAPIEIRNKDKWINKERVRWAKQFNIPLAEKTPEPFPQLTLTAQRALCAVVLHQPAKLDACIEALYNTFWIERKPIKDAAVVTAALATVLGEAEAKRMLEKAGSPEVKKLLTDNSNLAIDEGAFGLPYFVCTNAEGVKEGFWGFDHLGQIVDFLGLQRDQKGFRAML